MLGLATTFQEWSASLPMACLAWSWLAVTAPWWKACAGETLSMRRLLKTRDTIAVPTTHRHTADTGLNCLFIHQTPFPLCYSSKGHMWSLPVIVTEHLTETE